MNPLTQSKNTIILPLLIALTLGCFGLSPQAQAVCQEGCLTNQNTLLGDDALLNNTATANTAVGFDALFFNTGGGFNTGIGAFALFRNKTGTENTAIGYGALPANGSGKSNTASGRSALEANKSGSNNTATGYAALLSNTTGRDNIALGYFAGQNLTTGSHNIYIGNFGGSDDESGKIRIGKVGGHTDTFIAGISGGTVPDGVGVIVSAKGKLGTIVSSERFKDEIKPMEKASEVILSLKPVTFRYKHELDPEGIPQFGLVAEQVEKVNPALVARDDQGKPYTVRYEAVNAMLLNEFLKEHRKVQELEANDVQQQNAIKALTAMVKEQASQIQKVSAQLEMSKTAPQTVANNQ
jgi:hypothetical protein